MAVQNLMPEIQKLVIKEGLKARQIYKLLYPVALINTPATNQILTSFMQDEMLPLFAHNNYSSPYFLSMATNQSL